MKSLVYNQIGDFMKVIILNPHGYCGGVKKAIDKVISSLNNPSIPRPIYLLGNVIHNKYITKKLEDLGAITINQNNRTRLEMLDDISAGTVIFSAHGVSDKVREKAKEKKLNIIDATCPNVLYIQNKIKDYLKNGYEVLYIGTMKHPECEAVLELDSRINLYNNDFDLRKLTEKKVYVTNQTTLSMLEIKNIYNHITNVLPNAIIDNKICNATTLRQEALINNKAELTIVVGDKLSSNSKKLCEISESLGHTKAILIESAHDLKNIDFKNVQTINLTSAASTPEELLVSVYEALNKI